MNTSNALKQICAFKTSIKEEMTVWYMKVHTWRNDFLFYCNSVAQAPGGVDSGQIVYLERRKSGWRLAVFHFLFFSQEAWKQLLPFCETPWAFS